MLDNIEHHFMANDDHVRHYKMPEYILPRDLVPGSKEHAQYLTFVISIDYMTDAVKLWRNAREVY
jgi:hypothetical protein